MQLKICAICISNCRCCYVIVSFFSKFRFFWMKSFYIFLSVALPLSTLFQVSTPVSWVRSQKFKLNQTGRPGTTLR